MLLYYETHSTSTDNELGIASGHNDPDLSPLGEEQARGLGERYREVPLEAVYYSDLKRARRTAENAFAGRAVTLYEDPRLRECDYGELNGAPVAEVHGARGYHVVTPFPGGESYQQVAERVAAFLREIGTGSGPVLIIGHRATQHAIEHIVTGAPLAELVEAQFEWQPGWRYELT
jgi:broad specificity phosphatase PhoE